VTSSLPIAAVISRASGDADDLLAACAARWQAEGRRVRGLLQANCESAGKCRLSLIDLADGSVMPITQELGSGSSACSLDPQRLTEAGNALRRALAEGADLVIVNRFGALEAAGEGFAAEMLEIMSRGIPLLTVVPLPRLEAWRHFTGGLGVELAAEAAALTAWFAALGKRS